MDARGAASIFSAACASSFLEITLCRDMLFFKMAYRDAAFAEIAIYAVEGRYALRFSPMADALYAHFTIYCRCR